MAWLGLVAARRLPLPTPRKTMARPAPCQRRFVWSLWLAGVAAWVVLAVVALRVLAAALLAGGLLLALVLLLVPTPTQPRPRRNRLGPVRQMTPPPARKPPAPCRIPVQPPTRRLRSWG